MLNKAVKPGVKQGCLLSPTLVNMFIVDLDPMLSGHGGVTIDYAINGQYYADDVVLFVDSDSNLQEMLRPADRFAK